MFPLNPPCDGEKDPMGPSPAVLANRYLVKPNPWCTKLNIEFDSLCDEDNPKTITYKNVAKAAIAIKNELTQIPLKKSYHCTQLDVELYYKYELFHRTGSFHERGALYSLQNLNDAQRAAGVITASVGNWAKAIAYHGQRLHVPVTVILPISTISDTQRICEEYGAKVILHGNNICEAKRQAFQIISDGATYTYINGYDHPDVIAGAGTIAIEILEQLPETQAILVPVGGGGLIAGISAVVKKLRPEILVYGIQPEKCCSFYKAMENNRPVNTTLSRNLAESLAVPLVGCNAFQTARTLIDKMVLINDDFISRAILHLAEEEKVIAEGAGAIGLSALLATPNILPELRNKTVVCVITGGNIENITLSRCLSRAKAIEGRLMKMTIGINTTDDYEHAKILRIIAGLNCNVIYSHRENAWVTENNFYTVYMTLICETRDLQHACSIKRIMNKLFPNMCQFEEEPFEPIQKCCCFPKIFM